MAGSRKTLGILVLAAVALVVRLGAAIGLAEVSLVRGAAQSLAGVALVLTVAWLAGTLVPDRPAASWLAAVALALFPPQVALAGRDGSFVWAALLTALLTAVAVSPRWRSARHGPAAAGVLAAGLVLIAPVAAAVAVPVGSAVFWLGQADTWRHRVSRMALARAAVAPALALIAAGGWFVGSWQTEGRPAAGSAIAEAFWRGNAELGTPDEATDFNATTPQGDADRPDAIRAIRENPALYAGLCARRLGSFLLFDGASLAPRTPGRRVEQIASVAWLVLAGVGLWLSRDRWRTFWPTYLVFAGLAAFHVLVVAADHARAPVEPLAFLWIAAGMAPVLARIVGRPPPLRIHRPGRHAEDATPEPHVLRGPHFDLPPRRRAG